MDNSKYGIIVDSLSAHVAVLDERGVIVETNRAWQRFAEENEMVGRLDSVGDDYLAVCEAARKRGDPEGELVARGIQQVLAGEIPEFVLQYPCHSPTRKQWYNLRVLPYRSTAEHWVLVVHEDISAIIAAQEELRRKEEELLGKSEKLEEANVALKVLIEHRQRDLEDLEQRFTANIRELVLPYTEKLKARLKGEQERALLEIVEDHLGDIISPFLHRLSSLQLLLTPQEVEVAILVRQGRRSQEISDLLGVSLSTVSFHRKNLRRKLGLEERSRNLRTFLLSLQ